MTIVEVLLALIFVAIVVFIGIYIANNHKNDAVTSAPTAAEKSSAVAPQSTTTTPKLHTTQEATSLVQKTYDDYVFAVHNAGADNTQPLGIVGLNAVKGSLTDDLYNKAAASHNGGDFSCAPQFAPNKYTTALNSSNTTDAIVGLTIDGSTTGMTATVNLTSLKITAVSCPS